MCCCHYVEPKCQLVRLLIKDLLLSVMSQSIRRTERHSSINRRLLNKLWRIEYVYGRIVLRSAKEPISY